MSSEPILDENAEKEAEYLLLESILRNSAKLGVAEWVNATGDALVSWTLSTAKLENLATDEGLAFLRQRMNKA